ncbi:Mitogen-activated protein kinase kinase 10 [Colletotrichum chlorophyti]|uniref:EKC/KEOPS complex subunit BUD32 n=1 Tax=Colletotrichum chlorophyti TaxID=708187 RepID=A0A1Q8RS61_9PEZI|nr:Mitogen-activated protein kinase kinase 10 [Colletotrichum chlorophyti]
MSPEVPIYLVGATGAEYTVDADVGGEHCLYELWDGRRFTYADDPGAGQQVVDVSIVKAVCLSPKQEVRFMEFAERETRLSKKASFKNIIRYLDYLPDIHALCMERFTLEDALDVREARLDDEGILALAWDILSALAYLHGRGLVHGDVRPRNILVFPASETADGSRPREQYKLFGHGIVKAQRHKSDGYTAPELQRHKQSSRKEDGFKADVWMLGVLLWQCHRYGKGHDAAVPPASRPSGHARLAKPDLEQGSLDGLSPLLLRPSGCEPRAHGDVESLLRKMLIEEPSERYGAMELVEEISRARWLRRGQAAAEGEEVWGIREAVAMARRETRKGVLRRIFATVRGVFRGLGWALLG